MILIDYSAFDIDGNQMQYFHLLQKSLLELADNLPEEDPKFDETYKVICKKQEMQKIKNNDYSAHFRHTLGYLKKASESLDIELNR